jgi:alpha-L-fucosidase
MFIHWGLYSALGRGEWAMSYERIPLERYKRYALQFKAENYDPREWVKLAKQAGMKYMILTTKHHDGYCLFDTQSTDFNAVKVGPGKDLVQEFVTACRKEKMRIGFYFSLADWSKQSLKLMTKDKRSWNEFLKNTVFCQLRELLSHYGKIDILWYDGCLGQDPVAWRSQSLNRMARKIQPDILINERSALPEDFDTPEQHLIPSAGKRLWECCMTLNNSWGYNRCDTDWKSPAAVIRNLATCAHNGGNYLLNVGPMGNGTIPRKTVSILSEVGRWLRENAEAIYYTYPRPFQYAPQKITTHKGNKAYIHLFPEHWRRGRICIAGIRNRIKRAYYLTTRERIAFEQDKEHVYLLNTSARPPDKYNTVVVLVLEGRPRGIVSK